MNEWVVGWFAEENRGGEEEKRRGEERRVEWELVGCFEGW